MTAKQLFNKTMPFIWAKLALGGIMVLVAVVLLAIMMGLGWLFGDWGMVLMFIGWMAAIRAFWLLIMHYFGYMIKAGHIAVIAEACFTGQVPANQVEYGKNAVKERFLTSNVYFAVDKLVTAAIREIQKGIGKVGDFLDFIPGAEAVTGAAQFFVSIALGYVDECCLGWTFYNKHQGAFKSAADGVVIYAQNWKAVLMGALKTMGKVILLTVVLALVIFVPVGILFKILKWSGLFAFILACVIAWVVKFAVMDSYMMIQMMSVYMGVAPNTTITFDLYNSLCSISKQFKELFTKGQAEQPTGQPQPAYAAAAAGAQPVQRPVQQPAGQPAAAKLVFCGQCGTKNEPGTRFCGSCGAKL